VGYNDTIQTPHDFGGPREDLWAFNPLTVHFCNVIRAVDFVESPGTVATRPHACPVRDRRNLAL
jgi:hypothetical protein